MSGLDQLIREDARLIILKALTEQPDEQLNSTILTQVVETFGGIRKTREWVHEELRWLAEIGAIRVVEAGTVRIAKLLEKGADHVARRIVIEGIKRPSREG